MLEDENGEEWCLKTLATFVATDRLPRACSHFSLREGEESGIAALWWKGGGGVVGCEARVGHRGVL
jgi:hypothetical protein